MKKTERFERLAIFIIIGAVFLLLNACDTGMSQQDRLDAFQADIVAGADASGHFRGPNADTIDENTFLSTSLSPSNDIIFYTGDVISNDSFVITYNYTPGDEQASGSFVNAGSGGLAGDDWYISSITINELEILDLAKTIP